MPRSDAAARLAVRRAQLALLDTTLICACERAAGHGRHGHMPPADPARWDRSAWHRYLAEARTQNRILGGRMRQIQSEIAQLEQRDRRSKGQPGGGARSPSPVSASATTALLTHNIASTVARSG